LLRASSHTPMAWAPAGDSAVAEAAERRLPVPNVEIWQTAKGKLILLEAATWT
jgi:hypothetical protein